VKTTFVGRRVRVLAAGSYREVWLTRPEARNALDICMRDELHQLLSTLGSDTRAFRIALLGEGPDFCAGGDLREFGSRPDVATAWQTRLVRSLPAVFAARAPRLVVGIQGAAVGAGIELAAFAQCVICTRTARFRLPETDFGLIPGSGGTVSLPLRIGRQRTFQLAISGEWLDAQRARDWGLIDQIVDATDLLRAVRTAAAA
jgi:enoyl-CoA hydratase/carnithine racemase